MFNWIKIIRKASVIKILNKLNEKYKDDNAALRVLLDVAIELGIDLDEKGNFV